MRKKVLILLIILSVTVSGLIITTMMNANPLFYLDPLVKAKGIALTDSKVKNLIDGSKYTISISGWGYNPKVNPFTYYPEVTIFLTNNTIVTVDVDLLNNKVIKVDKSTSEALEQ